jgi:hypothetical protein
MQLRRIAARTSNVCLADVRRLARKNHLVDAAVRGRQQAHVRRDDITCAVVSHIRVARSAAPIANAATSETGGNIPVVSLTMSPGTTSLLGIVVTAPPRTTMHVGLDSSDSALSAVSAAFSAARSGIGSGGGGGGDLICRTCHCAQRGNNENDEHDGHTLHIVAHGARGNGGCLRAARQGVRRCAPRLRSAHQQQHDNQVVELHKEALPQRQRRLADQLVLAVGGLASRL